MNTPGDHPLPPKLWPLPPEWDKVIPPSPVTVVTGKVQGVDCTAPFWNAEWLQGLEKYVRSIVRDELAKRGLLTPEYKNSACLQCRLHCSNTPKSAWDGDAHTDCMMGKDTARQFPCDDFESALSQQAHDCTRKGVFG